MAARHAMRNSRFGSGVEALPPWRALLLRAILAAARQVCRSVAASKAAPIFRRASFMRRVDASSGVEALTNFAHASKSNARYDMYKSISWSSASSLSMAS